MNEPQPHLRDIMSADPQSLEALRAALRGTYKTGKATFEVGQDVDPELVTLLRPEDTHAEAIPLQREAREEHDRLRTSVREHLPKAEELRQKRLDKVAATERSKKARLENESLAASVREHGPKAEALRERRKALAADNRTNRKKAKATTRQEETKAGRKAAQPTHIPSGDSSKAEGEILVGEVLEPRRPKQDKKRPEAKPTPKIIDSTVIREETRKEYDRMRASVDERGPRIEELRRRRMAAEAAKKSQPVAQDPAASVESTTGQSVRPEVVETRTESGRFNIAVGQAEKAHRGEDRIINDPEGQVFAVIDGMGGHGSADVAAQIVADRLSSALGNSTTLGFKEGGVLLVSEAFKSANALLQLRALDEDGSPDMGAAASVIMLFEDEYGELYAAYGHIGDTRIYLKEPDSSEVRQITQDEGFGNRLTNSLTADQDANTVFEQFGLVKIKPGSRFMICSDGITGDFPDQFLTPEEFAEALAIENPQEAARRFLELSKKEDDKSVLVIDITGSEEEVGSEGESRDDIGLGEDATDIAPVDLLRGDDEPEERESLLSVADQANRLAPVIRQRWGRQPFFMEAPDPQAALLEYIRDHTFNGTTIDPRLLPLADSIIYERLYGSDKQAKRLERELILQASEMDRREDWEKNPADEAAVRESRVREVAGAAIGSVSGFKDWIRRTDVPTRKDRRAAREAQRIPMPVAKDPELKRQIQAIGNYIRQQINDQPEAWDEQDLELAATNDHLSKEEFRTIYRGYDNLTPAQQEELLNARFPETTEEVEDEIRGDGRWKSLLKKGLDKLPRRNRAERTEADAPFVGAAILPDVEVEAEDEPGDVRYPSVVEQAERRRGRS